MDQASDVVYPPKPRAAVSASFGADAGAMCTGSIFSLGQLPATLIEDSASAGNGMALVGCTVHPMGGNKYSVLGHAAISGKPGGLDFMGTLTDNGTQMLDLVMLQSMAGMPVNKMMCTATHVMPVSAGKVWLKLTCASSPMPPPDGCAVEAEARFENCTQ